MPLRNDQSSVYQIADLEVDLGQECVRRNGQRLELPLLSYRVLAALIEAAPDWLTTERLLDKVWPDTVVNEETVKQRISLLRRALGDSASEERYIQSSRGRGYRLPAAAIRVSTQRRKARPVQWYFLPIGLLLFVSFVMWRLQGHRADDNWPPFLAPASQLAKDHPEVVDDYVRAVGFIQRDEPHHLSGAVELLHSVVERAPDSPAALGAAAYALAAKIADWGGSAEVPLQVEHLAERALLSEANQVSSQLALAILATRDGRYSEAGSWLQAASQSAPELTEINRRKAQLAIQRGHYDQALIMLHNLKQPDFRDQALIAACMWELGMMDEARAVWLQQVRERPQWWLPEYYLSLDDLLAGRHQSAAERMDKLLALYPACQRCMHRAATIAAAMGSDRRAKELFSQALAASPRDNYMRARLSLLLESSGDTTAAETLMVEAEAIAKAAMTAGDEGWIHPWILAGIATAAGDDRVTEHWLRRALAAGRVRHRWDRNEVMFARVQSSPWFDRILNEMAARQAEMAESARRAGVESPL